MATTRSNGYVVSAAVWNAVLSRLTDDGATFSGAVNGSTGAFSSTLAVTGAATLSSTLAVSGVATLSAAANRALQITRASADAGIQITSSGGSGKSYGIVSGSDGAFRIQDDSDGTPLIALSGNNVALEATAGVTNANYYHSATAQPGFLAYNGSSDTGLTVATVLPADTEVYDRAANFASNTFTAPVAGDYLFAAAAYLENTAGTSKTFTLSLEHSAGPASWTLMVRTLANAEFGTLAGSLVLSLAQGDTVYGRVVSGGSGNNFSILGGLSTYFSGRLLA